MDKYDLENEIGKRLGVLTEGLNTKEALAIFEEIVDELTFSLYGLTIISELKKVKNASGCVTIQPLIGKAVMVSPYGFEVISETTHPKGGKRLILQEVTKKESEKERDSQY